ncbi:helix-turn-helix domain-containing protein [Rhodoblastus acidophilus]|uniref:Helix-turn-helix domain-containing protein n=1 Tax=Rhodoblastus acidophilus TaxID=1074 RepID=A0A6N8DJC4_RHOAC|nr:AraC family transcriptional regulator [Rhodoblastus acidophilus]MCW2273395.1 AraC-like DNA-binding protein [Rhodoblastus acidophilus]MTV30519.1 helix-turn-helix domain-containing protein [Rhodoblastus acidophilus]
MTDVSHRIVRHDARHEGVEAMSLATNHCFPRHSHDEFGLGLVTFGGQRSWSGRGFVEALPDDLISVNPGEMHDGAPVGRGARGWRMIYLRPEVLGFLAEDQGTGPFEFARPSFADAIAKRLFSELFDALVAPEAEALAIDERMVGLFGHLARSWSASAPRRRDPPPAVARAARKIDDDPTAKASLAELAALAGVSRYQLLRGFARHMGATPHVYLMQRRALLARSLLLSGLSPACVAAQAGFADQSHLTRVFFRHFCMTPARFQAARGAR